MLRRLVLLALIVLCVLIVVLCVCARPVLPRRALRWRRGLQVSLPMDIIMASPPRGLKMAIVLWSDEPIYDYALPAWRLNCMYGRRHGIDVIRSSRRRWNKHAMWQRVPLLRQYLPDYDYVMWVDADAAFDPWAPHVAELIAAQDFPDVILTEDFPEGTRFGAFQGRLSDADARATNINSGVVVIRNSAGGHALLDMWSKADITYEHDQCFLRLLYHQYLQKSADFGRVVRMGRGELQWLLRHAEPSSVSFSQPSRRGYIWHLAGASAAAREPPGRMNSASRGNCAL